MTLPSSGAISLANVNTELGRSSTATISLGETAVRNLAGVSSGAIALSNLYGKSSSLASAVVTVGTNGENWGYSRGNFGGVTPLNWAVSGTAYSQLIFVAPYGGWIEFNVLGYWPNSGWNNLRIGAMDYPRTSWFYSDWGSFAQWIYFTVDNPYGYVSGATRTLVWT